MVSKMESSNNNTQVFRYIFNIVKEFPLGILIMIAVSIIYAIHISLHPYILKIIIDRAADNNVNMFAHLGIPVLAFLGLSIFLNISFRIYDYYIPLKMMPLLRKKIAEDAFKDLINKNHQFYLDNFSGSLANKAKDLVRSVPRIIEISTDSFFFNVLSVIIAIFTLAQVNLLFASFMFVWSFLLVICCVYFTKYASSLADAEAECFSIITGKIVDSFSNILSIRLFSARNQERKILNHTLNEAVIAERALAKAYFWIWLYFGFSFCLLQSFNLFFLIKGREEGWVTVGDFALVALINISIVDFLWQVTREFTEYSRLLGWVSQALRATTSSHKTFDADNATELKISQGQVMFDKVHFHYKSAGPLFEDKSIIIAPGEKVGLVGFSGSGKTSFVNLILRLYEINKGRILIDGQDIAKVTQDSLHKQIAMIPQDPSLFHRSLMENIRYGLEEASDEQVISAAKKAHAHEFISSLPDGYNTLVGERGVKLSGGQRQRIAIARAIIKNAPILILDEATSQLDSVTEELIQASLWGLMQGRTTIVIAHRLSTLTHMDRILVFSQGVIIQDGSHQELLAKDGLYRTLWNAQVNGFLPD